MMGAQLLNTTLRQTLAGVAALIPTTEPTGDVECRDYHKLNSSLQCEFIRNTSDCGIDEGFINYLHFPYCSLPNLVPLALVILFLWLLVLFVLLGVTADDYFCPALKVISDTLKLSQNIAGVTFLAFGNGAPDIFSAVAAITNSKGGDAGLAIGALFGAGVFVTTVVVGAVGILTPFEMMQRPFLRDVVFYIAAAFWTWCVLWFKNISLPQAIGFIGLYVVYVFVVLVGRQIRQSRLKASQSQSRIPTDFSNNYNINGTSADPDEEYLSFRQPSGKHVNPRRAVKGTLQVTEGVTVGPLLGAQAGVNPALQAQTSVDLSRSSFSNSGERMPLLGSIREEDAGCCTPLAFRTELWEGLNPIDTAGWSSKGAFGKGYEVFKAPIQLVLNLTVSIVDFEEDKHNWNRPLNCLHCITGPLFVVFAINNGFDKIGGMVPVWAVVAVCGLLLAIVVFCTSNDETYPIYHWAFGYLAFVVSVVWIYATANEIVNLLQVFGLVFNISDAILGLTLLAWGNSIGDLVADTAMARQGFPRMGVSACFGGPLFNMLMGIGISCTIATIKNGGNFPLKRTMLQSVLAGSLGFSLLSSLILIPAFKFKVGRWYGIYLIVVYIAFLGLAIATEFGAFGEM
ncbi:mitochondrial sodium/calcium exchanger protein-like isoform X2 [Branchiostoma lanceolatum]|uniref:mitochondrial sodium/calcium exchanger protein-like isoform X2 n=1 Tax=Branchiostoma lanceolatum TaxID=7740 RepID=UPI00345136FE